jgi:SAM-dependent methyltransferase
VSRFTDLLAEGSSVPVEGWNFSWFEGRGTEERPPWGYSRLLRAKMEALSKAPDSTALDLQTGGGEVLSSIPIKPTRVVATEGWKPNVEVACRNLSGLGVQLVESNSISDLPFKDASFNLVASRHPEHVLWPEVARVLKPGGSYFSQGVGDGSALELTEYLIGHQHEERPHQEPLRSAVCAEAAGLKVVDLREFRGHMQFFDVAAVVYFLRKVIWIVPGFTVERYRDQLHSLHRRIERDGPLVATTARFLLEARK